MYDARDTRKAITLITLKPRLTFVLLSLYFDTGSKERSVEATHKLGARSLWLKISRSSNCKPPNLFDRPQTLVPTQTESPPALRHSATQRHTPRGKSIRAFLPPQALPRAHRRSDRPRSPDAASDHVGVAGANGMSFSGRASHAQSSCRHLPRGTKLVTEGPIPRLIDRHPSPLPAAPPPPSHTRREASPRMAPT